jgi:hypothetical protein
MMTQVRGDTSCSKVRIKLHGFLPFADTLASSEQRGERKSIGLQACLAHLFEVNDGFIVSAHTVRSISVSCG